jgi:hypothetical protein
MESEDVRDELAHPPALVQNVRLTAFARPLLGLPRLMDTQRLFCGIPR